MYLERAGLGQLPSVFICSPYFIPYRFISQKLKGLWEELKKHPLAWIGWGSVAGIGFYSLLSFAAVFSPLARCWNLASYYISRFTTLAIIFR